MAHFNKADWLRGVPVSACGGGVASLKRGHMLGTVPAMRNKIPKITLRISDKTCPTPWAAPVTRHEALQMYCLSGECVCNNVVQCAWEAMF